MTKPGDILISHKKIEKRIGEMAREIALRFQGKNLLVIGVLKGAFIITADLGRKLYEAGLDDITLDFIAAESYNGRTESSGKIKILQDMKTNIRGRHILVVEDIIDTGLTIKKIDKHLRQKKPASLTTFALLEKPERRKVDFLVDYIGFKIPNLFVQGYGLDWDQFGRFNQDIFVGPVKPNHR